MMMLNGGPVIRSTPGNGLSASPAMLTTLTASVCDVLAPHCGQWFGVGGAVEPKTFAAAVAAEMAVSSSPSPAPDSPWRESAAIDGVRSQYELRSYADAEGVVFISPTGASGR